MLGGINVAYPFYMGTSEEYNVTPLWRSVVLSGFAFTFAVLMLLVRHMDGHPDRVEDNFEDHLMNVEKRVNRIETRFEKDLNGFAGRIERNDVAIQMLTNSVTTIVTQMKFFGKQIMEHREISEKHYNKGNP